MDVSSGTKRNYFRSIKRAMKWDEEQGYIDRSPIAFLKQTKQGRRDNVVPEADYEQILALTKDQNFRDLVNKEAGRDHRPQCYTMVLAGGGIRGGQYVGESDKTGAYPWSRPIIPADVHATVFTALGYDPHGITYHQIDSRPIPLSQGAAIREVL